MRSIEAYQKVPLSGGGTPMDVASDSAENHLVLGAETLGITD